MKLLGKGNGEMLVLEVTYKCLEPDENKALAEGENAYRVRVEENFVDGLPGGAQRFSPVAYHLVEDILRSVECLQGREYVNGSICDVRVVNGSEQ